MNIVAHRLFGILLGAFGFFCAVVSGFVFYVFVGVSTGVLALCASAPEWWCTVYLWLGAAIPVTGIWIWVQLTKWYIARGTRLDKLRQLEIS